MKHNDLWAQAVAKTVEHYYGDDAEPHRRAYLAAFGNPEFWTVGLMVILLLMAVLAQLGVLS